MKQSNDFSTIDMLPGSRRRGRPVTGHALSAAERKAKSRAAKAGVMSTLTVEVPADVVEAMREFLEFKDETQSQLIARLLRSQLLRKR